MEHLALARLLLLLLLLTAVATDDDWLAWMRRWEESTVILTNTSRHRSLIDDVDESVDISMISDAYISRCKSHAVARPVC